MTDQPAELMDRDGQPGELIEGAFRSLDRSHRWLGTYRRLVNQLLVHCSDETDEITILDVGGGDGRFGDFLARHFEQIQYLSLDPKASEYARELRNGSHLTGKAPPLPIADDAVDAVISLLTLHHVPDPILPDFLTECQRVAERVTLHEDLRPGILHRGMAWLFSRLSSTNPIYHHDTMASIRRSRSISFWKQLIKKFDLPYRLRTTFPFRCQLIHSAHG